MFFDRTFLIDRKNMEMLKFRHRIYNLNFSNGGEKMDREELKSKIMKGFTIALPILLVAILAMLIVNTSFYFNI